MSPPSAMGCLTTRSPGWDLPRFSSMRCFPVSADFPAVYRYLSKEPFLPRSVFYLKGCPAMRSGCKTAVCALDQAGLSFPRTHGSPRRQEPCLCPPRSGAVTPADRPHPAPAVAWSWAAGGKGAQSPAMAKLHLHFQHGLIQKPLSCRGTRC